MTVVDGSTLTAVEVRLLLEGAELRVDSGLDLLDSDDVLIADISDDFVAAGSQVERGMYKTLHGSCRISVARELVWGSQRVRPFLLLSADGVSWFRWNLGVFRLSTPERRVSVSPPVWDVDGFDKLDVLNTSHGESFTIAAGENVVQAVAGLVEGRGESRLRFVPSDAVQASTRTFSLIDNETTLQIGNSLFGSIGYRSLFADRDGWIVGEPYRSPIESSPVFGFDAQSATTTVGEERTAVYDFYRAANTVVVYDDSPERLTPPVPGDGIVRLVNEADGETSVAGRGGTAIVRTQGGAYSSQASLEVAARRIMDSESRVTSYVEIAATVNPLFWHFDVTDYKDSEIPVDGRYLVTDWVLPLDGSDMNLSLRGV